MTALLRRLRCALTGHPDSVAAWGPWRGTLTTGRYRVITEQCVRCHGVLSVASLTEPAL
jgi:hypothetical protein